MHLKRALTSSVATICMVAIGLPMGTAAAAAPGLAVKVGQARDFTRIEVSGPGAAGAAVSRSGQSVTLRFAVDAYPDIAVLRTSPPKWIKSVEGRRFKGRYELSILLVDDADLRIGRADGATYINAFAKPDPKLAEPPKDKPQDKAKPQAPSRPAAMALVSALTPALAPASTRVPTNPVPAGGAVRVTLLRDAGGARLVFPWAGPVGAASFQRGNAVWIVFDTPVRLDVSAIPKDYLQGSALQVLSGTDYSAIRLESPANEPLSAGLLGNVWTVAMGLPRLSPTSEIRLTRDGTTGPATLKSVVAGATRTLKVNDPIVGDVLDIVPALGPAKGVSAQRDYVEVTILRSAQGLALDARVPDLTLRHDRDLVYIGRPSGMALSDISAGMVQPNSQLGPPQAAILPGLITTEAWAQTGRGGFHKRYEQLLADASAEGARTHNGPVKARMAFARFLVGSELSFEAIGLLNATARNSPYVLNDPEFRGLRAIARIMSRRYKEAEADLTSPALAGDPSAALWKAYSAAQSGQWSEALARYSEGASVLNQMPPIWRTRFARSDAEAAFAMGDLERAKSSVRRALLDHTNGTEELATRLVQARIFEASGDLTRALNVYNAIAASPVESLATAAMRNATQLRLKLGKVTPQQATEVLGALKFRWRGDGSELQTIRALGQIYLDQGRYREGLETLRSAGNRMPDIPEAEKLQTDLSGAFHALFLEGAADGLEPIQALALFLDFKELTPLGADGDLMVRKLVSRLVDVDLLDQAAELLKYQTENRLDGVPKAEVATDLAVIYLMNRQPELALQAINGSRTTLLPMPLNLERRRLEARALINLGRVDTAGEFLEGDKTPEAQDLRMEILWRQKAWPAVGSASESALGNRWKSPAQLNGDEEGKLLRAAIAYSLADDEASLTRLRTRYKGFLDKARNAEALNLALTSSAADQVSAQDFARLTTANDMFATWITKVKDRLRAGTSPGAALANKPATGKAPPVKKG